MKLLVIGAFVGIWTAFGACFLVELANPRNKILESGIIFYCLDYWVNGRLVIPTEWARNEYKKVTSQQRRGLTDGIKGLSKNNLERNNPLVIFDIFLFISSSSYAAGTDLHVSFGVKTKCRKL